MGIRLALFLILWVEICAFGQSNSVVRAIDPSSKQIQWQPSASVKISETEKLRFLSFNEATYASEDGFLPRYNQKVAMEIGPDWYVTKQGENAPG